jgi:hypothetical protein
LIACRRDDGSDAADGAVDGRCCGRTVHALFHADPPTSGYCSSTSLDYVASIADALAAPPDGFIWRVAWTTEAPNTAGAVRQPLL